MKLKYVNTQSLVAINACVGVLIAFPIQAEWSSLGTEERLTRLERVLQTQTNSIERLRKELQELRGKLELQSHTLDSLNTGNSVTANEVVKTPRIIKKPIEEETGETPLVPLDATPINNEQPVANTVDTSEDAATEEVASTSEAEIDIYNKAFEQLKAGQYAVAIKGFRAQLAAYPQGQYAGNAQYWLGETYYVTRDFDSAMSAFSQVLEQHPKSNKVAGATLKLGFIYHERGQSTKAIEFLEQVVSNFPNSTEAKLAQQRLGLLVR